MNLARYHLPRATALLRKWRRPHAALGALLTYCMLTLVWLRPLPWQLATHFSRPPGDPAVTAWRLIWPVQWLIQRPAPFLDTNVLYPTTNVFVRDELTLGGSFIAAPFYLLTHNPVLTYNIVLLFTFVFAAFCTYLLVTTWTAMPSVAFLAGSIVAFAPYRMAQIGHVGLLTFGWLPLLLLGLDQLVRTGKKRWMALLALAAAMQVLSAGYYGYLVALTVAVYLIVLVVACRSLLSWRTGWLIGLSLLIALLVVLPILLPYYRVAAAEHFSRRLSEVEFWSARPQSYLAATPANLLYGSLVRRTVWNRWVSEAYLFPGIVPVILAVIGAVGEKSWRRWLAIALTAVAFLLSLGPVLHLAQRDRGYFPLPYLLAYRFVPGVSGLRVPLRIAPLVMLGLALLAAWGALWLRRRLARMRGRGAILGRLIVPVLVLGILAEYLTAPLATVPAATGGHLSPPRQWLAAQPRAVICELPHLGSAGVMVNATYSHHRYVNGVAEVMPPAQRELFRMLHRAAERPADAKEAFRVLQAIGVDYLVLHRGEFSSTRWSGLQKTLADAAPLLEYRMADGETVVYQFTSAPGPYQSLRRAVPPNSRVFVSDGMVARDGVLEKAVVMHVLADRTIVSTLRTGWGPTPVAPQARMAYDFGIFYRNERVSAAWETNHPVWSDHRVVIYRPVGAGAAFQSSGRSRR